MPLSPRLRWKLNQYRQQFTHIFGSKRKEDGRPKLCPACGTLVGASATRCHQCGASLTFSIAAASKSLGRMMPATSPATYGILSMCCLIYGASLIATMRVSGFAPPSGGIMGIFNLGEINQRVLIQLGASLPFQLNLIEPWRFVTAVFLHASILHIGFNMWVLMDIGPAIEELYGSARYLFIFVATGIAGYVLSSYFSGIPSLGASGALLGLIGVLFAMTIGRRTASMQMLRSQMIRWLIYIVVWGLVFPGIDNLAHLGGFISGFLLGRIMAARPPMSAEERKRAYMLGWATALVVIASFGRIVYGIMMHQPY